MSERRSDELYQRLVAVSRGFLGPATDRFLLAQIERHLHKTPDQLTCQDIQILADWLGLYLAHVNNDQQEVQQYIEVVKSLKKQDR